MTSVIAATPPPEAESTPVEAEFTRLGAREPNGRTVVIHLVAVQAVWLAAIAFAIYSATS